MRKGNIFYPTYSLCSEETTRISFLNAVFMLNVSLPFLIAFSEDSFCISSRASREMAKSVYTGVHKNIRRTFTGWISEAAYAIQLDASDI